MSPPPPASPSCSEEEEDQEVEGAGGGGHETESDAPIPLRRGGGPAREPCEADQSEGQERARSLAGVASKREVPSRRKPKTSLSVLPPYLPIYLPIRISSHLSIYLSIHLFSSPYDKVHILAPHAHAHEHTFSS